MCSLLEHALTFRDVISTLYSKIVQVQRSSSLSENHWQFILKKRVHTSSICARHCLMQCRVKHRTHWKKQKMSRSFTNVSSAGNLCKLNSATQAHMFWSYAEKLGKLHWYNCNVKAKTIWSNVYNSDYCGRRGFSLCCPMHYLVIARTQEWLMVPTASPKVEWENVSYQAPLLRNHLPVLVWGQTPSFI